MPSASPSNAKLLQIALAGAVSIALLGIGGGSALGAVTSSKRATAAVQKTALKRAQSASQRFARTLTALPAPTIASGPPANTTKTEATFELRQRSAATFQCRLDQQSWRICGNTVRYVGLETGAHAFATRVAKAGIVSPQSTYAWTIKLSAPAPSPAAPQPPAAQPPAAAPTPAPTPPSAPAGPTTAPASPPALTPTTSASTFSVTPPTPPSAYTIPTGAVRVTNAASLNAALAGTTARDIVLADGTYDQSGPFNDYWGHRVYAEHLGGARLTAGFTFGQYWGVGNGLLQGLVFDITDSSKTLQSAVVHIWGTGSGTRILDITIDGHGVVEKGILAKQPEGVEISRVVVRNVLEFGIRLDGEVYDTVLARPGLLQDLNVSNVSLPTPLSSNGKAEACVWVGSTATVRRVRARDCAWEGLWAGTSAYNSLFEDIDIDRTRSGVGLYIEHFVRNSVFRRLRIGGPTITRGVVCEWADPSWGSKPACVGNVIEDSYFDTTCVGVLMDEGTTGTTVRRSTFVNQRWTAIDNYRGVSNLADTSANNYAGIRPGATSISTAHWSSSGC